MSEMLLGPSRTAWLQVPCHFIDRYYGEETCTCCRQPFSFFWNGRTNCEFCGCLVHAKCAAKVRTVAGGNRKRRICRTCSTYRDDYSPVLRLGDEFISYDDSLSAAAYIYLSEEKHSLIITMDPADKIIQVPLGEVLSVQKGFSHMGHVNASNQYDPIRCFSISIAPPSHDTQSHDHRPTTLNFKCHSPLHCQLWLNGLNTALFIYKRLLLQELTVTQLKAAGDSVPSLRKCIYFPDKKPSTDVAMDTNSSHESSLVVINSAEHNNGCGLSTGGTGNVPDLVVIDVSDAHNSRGSTPSGDILELTPPPSDEPIRTSPVVRKAHYKIRTIASPYCMVVQRRSPAPPTWDDALSIGSSSSDWRTKTTDSTGSCGGLPYRGHKNPLASYCTCHAYAIEPSSAMLVSSTSSFSREDDPFKSCCHQCRDKCRLLRDLALF